MKIRTQISYFVSFAVLIGIHNGVFAQEDEPDEDEILTIDSPITIDLEEEEETHVEARKKKRKKNVFYGRKTKKGFTKKGFGGEVTIELFHYIKGYHEPDPYVREIYWYDFRRKTIRKSRNIDPQFGVILHGPYKKMSGEQIIQQGIYYMGTKHGRWETYNSKNLLLDKRKYYKGWPKESIVTYYDEGETKLKEIIPVHYGKRDGDYYYFHQTGSIAVSGEFRNDQKIGKWTEFYQRRGRRKKVIQYRVNPYDYDFKPFIVKEWDTRGQLVYDREVEARRLSGR